MSVTVPVMVFLFVSRGGQVINNQRNKDFVLALRGDHKRDKRQTIGKLAATDRKEMRAFFYIFVFIIFAGNDH